MSQVRDISIALDQREVSKHTYTNESELIEGCVKGEREAQKMIYEQSHPVLLGVCLRYIDEKSTAEDILHEGFIQIFKKIRSFRGEAGLETWMTRIVINQCLQYLRKNRRSIIEYKNSIPPHFDDSEEDWSPIQDYSYQQILNLLKQLPVGYRTVLSLFAIDGYSHKEIAKRLRIKESTSRSQLAKARRMLTTIINQDGHEQKR